MVSMKFLIHIEPTWKLGLKASHIEKRPVPGSEIYVDWHDDECAI